MMMLTLAWDDLLEGWDRVDVGSALMIDIHPGALFPVKPSVSYDYPVEHVNATQKYLLTLEVSLTIETKDEDRK
jgi:hypothetical protein